MGRKLKMVDINFSYPLNKVWEGYLNPHYKKCPHCENGMTAAGQRLEDLVSLIMLSGEDSLKGKDHPYFTHISKGVYGFNAVPSKDMAELTSGLSGRSCDGRLFGHDCCDRWAAYRKIVSAAGLDEKWGVCPHCEGEAIDAEVRERYESWEEYEPPTGEGFQLWETTSEGSPISPVFDTLDKLASWCENNASTFGSSKTSKENWIKMLSEGLVPHQEGNIIFI